MVFLTSALCARVAKHTNEFFGRAQVIYFLQVFNFSLQYINLLLKSMDLTGSGRGESCTWWPPIYMAALETASTLQPDITFVSFSIPGLFLPGVCPNAILEILFSFSVTNTLLFVYPSKVSQKHEMFIFMGNLGISWLEFVPQKNEGGKKAWHKRLVGRKGWGPGQRVELQHMVGSTPWYCPIIPLLWRNMREALSRTGIQLDRHSISALALTGTNNRIIRRWRALEYFNEQNMEH